MARRRLGGNFARLWTAGAVSNLGDGVVLAAMPLLAASLTTPPPPSRWSSPRPARSPGSLFSLVGGAIADRTDRRRTMSVVDGMRFVAMAALGVALARRRRVDRAARDRELRPRDGRDGLRQRVAGDPARASSPTTQLETANGRLEGAQIVANQFVGPPLGAWLFGLAVSAPFFLDAGSFVFAARRSCSPCAARSDPSATVAGTTMRADIAEGVRWLVRHRVLRTLAIALGIINFVGIAAMTILVLYAQDVLHLTDFQYGLLLTVEAAGAVLGSMIAARDLGAARSRHDAVAGDRGVGRIVLRAGAVGPAGGGGGVARGRRRSAAWCGT